MLYNVGDVVCIRSDLRCGENYHDINPATMKRDEEWFTGTVDLMVKRAGTPVTISGAFGHFYSIEEDGGEWNWTDEMFDNLLSEEIFEPMSEDDIASFIGVLA